MCGGGRGCSANLNLCVFLLFLIIFSLPYLTISLEKALSNVSGFTRIEKTNKQTLN